MRRRPHSPDAAAFCLIARPNAGAKCGCAGGVPWSCAERPCATLPALFTAFHNAASRRYVYPGVGRVRQQLEKGVTALERVIAKGTRNAFLQAAVLVK